MTINSIPINTIISPSNTTSFPLLTLPPEIRTRILSFSLHPPHHLTFPTLKTTAQTYVSLQLTSHLVHAETRLLPFQCFPLALSATFGTNVAATLKILRKMRAWQIRCVRKAEVEVLGSVVEGCEAGRVIRSLRDGMGGEGGRVTPDIAWTFAQGGRRGMDGDVDVEEQDATSGTKDQQRNLYADERAGEGDEDSTSSELRELDIKITARDVMAPTAESVVGMEKTLDLDSSPLFKELIAGRSENRFPRLRTVTVSVELGASLDQNYDQDWVRDWKERLSNALNHPVCHRNSGNDNDTGRPEKAPVDVNVEFHHMALDARVMQAYFMALGGGDEEWDFSPANTQAGQMSVAMMSIGAPAGQFA